MNLPARRAELRDALTGTNGGSRSSSLRNMGLWPGSRLERNTRIPELRFMGGFVFICFPEVRQP